MKNGKLILGIAVLAALAGGWYAFRPERLFINQTVNEGLDTAKPADAMASSRPSDSPVPLAIGTFHSGSHETAGTAAVYELANGKRVLRLTDFHTSNGPDVQVYLVAANDASDDATVTRAGFVPVAALKGNVGDQNYDLPSDIDLSKYRAVTIWCRRFGKNFGTAPLRMDGGAMSATTAMSADAMAAGPQVLLEGAFHSGSHETKGNATVVALADGRRVLRLTDFHTSNGPDVQVYLIKASDATDNDTVTKQGFVLVAPLKGNVGDQNYELPSDLDLAKYHAVTIWCRRFGVNFGTAPLTPRS